MQAKILAPALIFEVSSACPGQIQLGFDYTAHELSAMRICHTTLTRCVKFALTSEQLWILRKSNLPVLTTVGLFFAAYRVIFFIT